MNDETSLGERIKMAREEKDLTQPQLGALVNVSKTTISQWERNKAWPTKDNFNQLSEALNKPKSFFYPKDEDAKDELSPKERALIEGFRAMPEPVQDAVATIIDNCSSKGGTK